MEKKKFSIGLEIKLPSFIQTGFESRLKKNMTWRYLDLKMN